MKAGFKSVLTSLTVGGCVAVGWLGTTVSAIAAETVVLTYGFVNLEIPIEDLEALAAGEETSRELERLLEVADQDPNTLRTTLNAPIEVSPVVLDTALNSPPGEWVLDQVSETIQTSSGVAGRQALRGALIGASADDNQITLLELMQVYPSPEIVVEGDRLLEIYTELYDVLEPLQDLADILGVLLED